MHLSNEGAACRQQIDEDEQAAFDEIGRLESAAAVIESERLAAQPIALARPGFFPVTEQTSVSDVAIVLSTVERDRFCDTAANIDGSGPSDVASASTTNEPSSYLTNHNSTYPASAEVRGCTSSEDQSAIDPGNTFEGDPPRTSCKRSGSPDTAGSELEFVKI